VPSGEPNSISLKTGLYLPHIGGVSGVNRRGIAHQKSSDNPAEMQAFLGFSPVSARRSAKRIVFAAE